MSLKGFRMGVRRVLEMRVWRVLQWELKGCYKGEFEGC